MSWIYILCLKHLGVQHKIDVSGVCASRGVGKTINIHSLLKIKFITTKKKSIFYTIQKCSLIVYKFDYVPAYTVI